MAADKVAPGKAAPGKVAAKNMEADEIAAEHLLSFDVAVDGSRFRMTFGRADGTTGAISLPSDCLQALVMTLPRMMTEALRARHRDDSLRLVYPAASIRIEQASDPGKLIVTFGTPDGFEVSFALGEPQMQALERARAERRGRNIPAKDVSGEDLPAEGSPARRMATRFN